MAHGPRAVPCARQFVIPFPPGGTASRFYSIHSCSVSLSLCAASDALLSRPHPSCMPEGAFSLLFVLNTSSVQAGPSNSITAWLQGRAVHIGGPALPCLPLFQSPLLPPSRPAFIRAAVGQWKRVVPCFTGVGSLLYRKHAYSRKYNYEAKTWNGRSRGRVSTLPWTNICSAWSPLAILLQIPMSRNHEITSMILRRLHL
ncbi:hypothetical protein EDB89DRAFT_280030 [Lactarius sanguifluus]|nr:hypothetical protein EDB89DRAFT_280030 [Lactarius sanguifluus]